MRGLWRHTATWWIEFLELGGRNPHAALVVDDRHLVPRDGRALKTGEFPQLPDPARLRVEQERAGAVWPLATIWNRPGAAASAGWPSGMGGWATAPAPATDAALDAAETGLPLDVAGAPALGLSLPPHPVKTTKAVAIDRDSMERIASCIRASRAPGVVPVIPESLARGHGRPTRYKESA
jgi:hypothetical protein